jgi:hypothetical protein
MQKQGIAQTRCYKLSKELSDSVSYPGIYDH